MSYTITTILVVLGLPTRNRDILAFAKSVLAGFTNNPHFPSPNPPLAVFAADVAAFDQAETALVTKAAGAATQRNAKKQKVVQDLHHLRDYAQGVGETLTADALSVIESTGLRAKKRGSVHKAPLVAKDGATSGEVHVVAKAVARVATYYWQYSLDGKAWVSCPDTLKASVTIGGLTPGQAYSLRFRTLTRGGASDFSQVVTHIVR